MVLKIIIVRLDLRDETVRKTHIIQNMLYMVELQHNVLVSQKIFGKDQIYSVVVFDTRINQLIPL